MQGKRIQGGRLGVFGASSYQELVQETKKIMHCYSIDQNLQVKTYYLLNGLLNDHIDMVKRILKYRILFWFIYSNAKINLHKHSIVQDAFYFCYEIVLLLCVNVLFYLLAVLLLLIKNNVCNNLFTVFCCS